MRSGATVKPFSCNKTKDLRISLAKRERAGMTLAWHRFRQGIKKHPGRTELKKVFLAAYLLSQVEEKNPNRNPAALVCHLSL